MTRATEFRFVEFRADGDTLTGVAVRYGDQAKIGSFAERFEPGSIEHRDVVVNVQHDRTMPVARSGAGLELVDSATELRARITLPDTQFARYAKELVDARIMRGLSMEFRADKERWEGQTRIIQKATLVGLALVDRPAYPDSKLAERMAEGRPAPRRKRRYV